MISIDRIGLPPSLLTALKHLASLHNPVFYERERLRLSTWATPRFIRCYEEDLERLHLPRGLLHRAHEIVRDAGSTLDVNDRRSDPGTLALQFSGMLTAQQRQAVNAVADHELGTLVAPPGNGKTVMACALIAQHAVPTLIVVDRKPLLEQWQARLASLLRLDPSQIGTLGGGKDRRSSIVDIAMIQSLTRRDRLDELFAAYGLVVVDECHHLPAVSFEACVRHAPVRRWLGLTATPYRRDGLESIIAMQCGPIRHEITADTTPSARTLDLRLVTHETTFDPDTDQAASIQEVFRGLVDDDERTAAICDDVAEVLAAGRNCLVLTQWTDHIDRLRSQLTARGHEPLVLRGGMGKKAQTAVLAALDQPGDQGGLLLIATGSYLGEGFDCPYLDTLFLTFPLAFKGRIVQYVGRIMRVHPDKHTVEVHDYVDSRVPVLARMHAKRLTGYRSLGFDTPGPSNDRDGPRLRSVGRPRG